MIIAKIFLGEPSPVLPPIPAYLKDSTIFEDKSLGIVMVADWGVRPTPLGNIPEQNYWLFRLHSDHWCSERKATSADLMTVKSLHALTERTGEKEGK